MEFRIADTFTDSLARLNLARLNTEEQKAAKITALDLQLNPAHPSLQFHKLEKAGNSDDRKGAISAFNGAPPNILVVSTKKAETKSVA